MAFRFRVPSLVLSLATLAFASAALAQSDDEPLARFEDPICPGVAGLKLEAAREMVEQIRACPPSSAVASRPTAIVRPTCSSLCPERAGVRSGRERE